jgi:hypothetical protein
MIDTESIEESKATFRRKLLWGAISTCAILFLLAWLGYQWYLDRDLKVAIGDADRLDPGWRLAELEAARAEVPDEENAAMQILAAQKLLPAGWFPPSPGTTSTTLEDYVDHLLPNERLTETQSKQLKSELSKARAALSAARQIAEMPRGRYIINWTPDAIGTLLPHVDQAHQITRLLKLEVVQRAENNDIGGALNSCRMLLNIGRSFGDEPIAVSQIVRRSCQRLALRSFERALAQGEGSKADLASLQRSLEDEEDQPLLLIAVRSERAIIHQFLDFVEAGQPYRARLGLRSRTGINSIDELLDRGQARGCHAAFLRYLNECVEMAKLPTEQQIERLRDFDREPPKNVPELLAALSGPLDGFQKLARLFHQGLAFLRCGAAAVALERYRLANGRWPNNLDDLVPQYLSKVPIDIYDRQPLHYRRLPDGVLIYTIGEDQKDDGGRRVRIKAGSSDADVGFQLWDPERRHQLPRPK